MWRGCGYFAVYLCLVKCPLRSTTAEKESLFKNLLLQPTSLAAAHLLLLQTTPREKRVSAVLNTCQQPPTATLIFTTMQIGGIMVSLLGSRGEHFNPQGLTASPGNTVFVHTLVLLMLAFDPKLRWFRKLRYRIQIYADSAAWSLQHPSAAFSDCDLEMCNPLWWIFMRHAGVSRNGCTCQHVQPQLRSSLHFGLCFKYQQRNWESIPRCFSSLYQAASNCIIMVCWLKFLLQSDEDWFYKSEMFAALKLAVHATEQRNNICGC